MIEAPGITLNLDHVNVECDPDGVVIVRCFDAGTSTLSVWVMHRVPDGWHMQASTVDVESTFDPEHVISIH